MVRKGTENDIPRIVEMAREFWQHTMFDEEFESESVVGMSELCMSQGLMSVIEVRDKVVGFACGIKGPLLASTKALVGTEIAWWVDPEYRSGRHGIILMQHLEKLAEEAGIKYWNMAYMETSMPKQIKGIYEKMGYKQAEVIYSRVL